MQHERAMKGYTAYFAQTSTKQVLVRAKRSQDLIDSSGRRIVISGIDFWERSEITCCDHASMYQYENLDISKTSGTVSSVFCTNVCLPTARNNNSTTHKAALLY